MARRIRIGRRSRKLGLDYRLMTQYTSFVAVEETTVIEGGKPRRVEVPVELPEGVSYEGIFGGAREGDQMMMTAMAPAQMRTPANMNIFVPGSPGSRVRWLPLRRRRDHFP